MNPPGIIKQKANFEKICDLKTEGILYFPREDLNGMFHVVSSSGEIFQFNDSSNEQILSLNGTACAFCFDNNGIIYVSDLSTGSIMMKQISTAEQNPMIETVLAKDFDGKPFKGATSMAYNKEESTLYFSDSGLFENGSMFPKDTDIFSIDLETRIIKKVLDNISFVSDLCYDSQRQCLYIAETFMNRILRLKQNDNGIFVSSIFHQFNGRIGPTALTLDENGNLYVGRFEYSLSENMETDIENDGLISVLNTEGILMGELTLPELPEISGLYISPKKRENLYLTEKNSTAVFKVKIASFTSDLDKLEELLKSENKK